MAIDKAVDSAKLDAGLTSIADAIRVKGGTSEKLQFPDGYVGAVNAIHVGTEMEDAFVERTFTTYQNDRVNTIGTSAFNSFSTLQEVSFQRVTEIGNNAFYVCKALKKINFPEVATVGANSFRFSAISSVAFPKLTSISASAFADCANLFTFVINKTDTICKLSSADAFRSTPIDNGTGYIYVPKSLVEEYKAATNWSTYAAQIRAIEDYPDITGG